MDLNAILPMLAAFLFAYIFVNASNRDSANKEKEKEKQTSPDMWGELLKLLYLLTSISLAAISCWSATYLQVTTYDPITYITTFSYVADPAINALGLPIIIIAGILLAILLFRFIRNVSKGLS